jgi:hypothetical protein
MASNDLPPLPATVARDLTEAARGLLAMMRERSKQKK